MARAVGAYFAVAGPALSVGHCVGSAMAPATRIRREDWAFAIGCAGRRRAETVAAVRPHDGRESRDGSAAVLSTLLFTVGVALRRSAAHLR
jgi:hypothetical protein